MHLFESAPNRSCVCDRNQQPNVNPPRIGWRAAQGRADLGQRWAMDCLSPGGQFAAAERVVPVAVTSLQGGWLCQSPLEIEVRDYSDDCESCLPCTFPGGPRRRCTRDEHSWNRGRAQAQRVLCHHPRRRCHRFFFRFLAFLPAASGGTVFPPAGLSWSSTVLICWSRRFTSPQ